MIIFVSDVDPSAYQSHPPSYFGSEKKTVSHFRFPRIWMVIIRNAVIASFSGKKKSFS